MISHIQDLVRKRPRELAPADITELIQDVVSIAQPTMEESTITLRVECGDLRPVMANRTELQQVLLNLILNSRDALGPASSLPREVSIHARPTQDGVVISVSDSGGEGPLPDTERMFDAFYTTKPDGLGLGLSISRSLIEAHGGRIWAEPNGPGLMVSFFLLA